MNPRRPLLNRQFKSVPHAPLVVLRSPSPQPSPAGRGRCSIRFRGSTITRLGQALGLLAAALLLAGSSAASEAQFEEANRLYETGQFAEAATLYRAVGTNEVSANLLFNLGNAHFKAGQLGQAMAAYHRSLRLANRPTPSRRRSPCASVGCANSRSANGPRSPRRRSRCCCCCWRRDS